MEAVCSSETPMNIYWTEWYHISLTLGRYAKVKAKLSLCLIKQEPHHEDIWGSGGGAPSFLTLALDKDKRLGGSRAGLDTVEKVR
jgi:hypothetical protein